MLTGMELMSCPNLAVSAEVIHHIVHVESSANPYAIGVVGGQLARQPQNLAEALATVRMLDAKGYNYSLGIAQVNRANFGTYGLDSYEKAFDTCANLSAGAHILADCHARAKGDWGKAFSCYYSGNFVAGYRDGYVQKVYASINQEAADQPADASRAIPQLPRNKGTTHPARPAALTLASSPNYRVALRSVAIDTAAAALPRSAVTSPSRSSPIDGMAASTVATAAIHAPDQAGADAKPPQPTGASGPTEATVGPAVFTPQVHGPGDTVAAASPDASSTLPGGAKPASASVDHADLRKEQRDAAFVF